MSDEPRALNARPDPDDPGAIAARRAFEYTRRHTAAQIHDPRWGANPAFQLLWADQLEELATLLREGAITLRYPPIETNRTPPGQPRRITFEYDRHERGFDEPEPIAITRMRQHVPERRE